MANGVTPSQLRQEAEARQRLAQAANQPPETPGPDDETPRRQRTAQERPATSTREARVRGLRQRVERDERKAQAAQPQVRSEPERGEAAARNARLSKEATDRARRVGRLGMLGLPVGAAGAAALQGIINSELAATPPEKRSSLQRFIMSQLQGGFDPSRAAEQGVRALVDWAGGRGNPWERGRAQAQQQQAADARMNTRYEQWRKGEPLEGGISDDELIMFQGAERTRRAIENDSTLAQLIGAGITGLESARMWATNLMEGVTAPFGSGGALARAYRVAEGLPDPTAEPAAEGESTLAIEPTAETFEQMDSDAVPPSLRERAQERVMARNRALAGQVGGVGELEPTRQAGIYQTVDEQGRPVFVGASERAVEGMEPGTLGPEGISQAARTARTREGLRRVYNREKYNARMRGQEYNESFGDFLAGQDVQPQPEDFTGEQRAVIAQGEADRIQARADLAEAYAKGAPGAVSQEDANRNAKTAMSLLENMGLNEGQRRTYMNKYGASVMNDIRLVPVYQLGEQMMEEANTKRGIGGFFRDLMNADVNPSSGQQLLHAMMKFGRRAYEARLAYDPSDPDDGARGGYSARAIDQPFEYRGSNFRLSDLNFATLDRISRWYEQQQQAQAQNEQQESRLRQIVGL